MNYRWCDCANPNCTLDHTERETLKNIRDSALTNKNIHWNCDADCSIQDHTCTAAERLVREAIDEQTGVTGYDLSATLSDVKADSLDAVEILMMVEDKLGKEIDTKALIGAKTVGDVVKIVEQYV